MTGFLLPDFLARALMASVGVALVAGPLGCFVVWRRMAYFGDATAHAALLGVAISVAFSVSAIFGALAIAAGMAIAVGSMSERRGRAADTLLGVLAHGALACGLLASSFTPGLRTDLMGYLFGDILSVSSRDLAIIWLGVLGVGAVVMISWRAWLNATLSEELVVAEGGSPARRRLVLTLSLAVLVAIAMQIVGLLMITSLLILPAATARPLVRSPEAMAFGAAGIGAFGAMGGLGAAFHFDAPAGPSIVATLFAAFLLVVAGAGALRVIRGA